MSTGTATVTTVVALLFGLGAFALLLRPLRPAHGREDEASPDAAIDLRTPTQAWSVPAGGTAPVQIRTPRATEVDGGGLVCC